MWGEETWDKILSSCNISVPPKETDREIRGQPKKYFKTNGIFNRLNPTDIKRMTKTLDIAMDLILLVTLMREN